MPRADRVLKGLYEVKRKRVDTRRGRKRGLAKHTIKKLMTSTGSIRAQQNPVGKSEYVSSRASVHNKQITFKFETRAKTKGKAKYPQTIIFHKVSFSDTKDKDHPLQVGIGDGSYVYMEKISAKAHPITVRCGCLDYYFMWGWSDQKSHAHAGPKIKKYVRKTPKPPEGYPERNPDEVPGLCKHLINCLKFLKKNKIVVA